MNRRLRTLPSLRHPLLVPRESSLIKTDMRGANSSIRIAFRIASASPAVIHIQTLSFERCPVPSCTSSVDPIRWLCPMSFGHDTSRTLSSLTLFTPLPCAFMHCRGGPVLAVLQYHLPGNYSKQSSYSPPRSRDASIRTTWSQGQSRKSKHPLGTARVWISDVEELVVPCTVSGASVGPVSSISCFLLFLWLGSGLRRFRYVKRGNTGGKKGKGKKKKKKPQDPKPKKLVASREPWPVRDSDLPGGKGVRVPALLHVCMVRNS